MRNRLTRRHHGDTDLDALLRAAGAPASEHELAGLPAALHGFRLATATAMTGPAAAARRPRRGTWITSRIAKIAVVAIGIAFAGGVSYAAVGGSFDWLLPAGSESPAVPPTDAPGLLPAGPSHEEAQNLSPTTSGTFVSRTSPAARTSASATVATIAITPGSINEPQPALRTLTPDPAPATSEVVTSVNPRGDAAPLSADPIDSGDADRPAESTPSTETTTSTAAMGPGPAALPGLCTAWRAHQASDSGNGSSSRTPAAGALINAAGGEDNIGAFCDDLLGPEATSTSATATSTSSTLAPPTTTTSAPGNSGGKGNSGHGGAGNSGNGQGNGNGNGNGHGNSGHGNGNGNG